MRGEDRAARRLGRVCSEDELERDVRGGPRELGLGDAGRGQCGERRVQRLARRPALVLVLAPPPQAVVLLGQVGELEVEAEGAEHLSLPLEWQRADGRRQVGTRSRPPGLPRLARQRPDPLLVCEQVLTLLLDEDAAEDLAEQPDVAAKWSFRVGGSHGMRSRRDPGRPAARFSL